MASFAFTTFGSFGDLFPLMPTALELERRGHVVRFVAPRLFGDVVRGEGFRFDSLPGLESDPGTPADLLVPGLSLADRYLLIARRYQLPPLAAAAAQLAQTSAEVDLLVTTPHQLAAPIAAEMTGAKWATLTYLAGMIPNREFPPMLNPFRRRRARADAVACGEAWRAFRLDLRALDPEVNLVREGLGLRPVEDALLEGGMSPHLSCVQVSNRFCPRPAEWPEHVKLTGFTYWDRPAGWQVPPELDQFLRAGEPPVVFSLGTSASLDPGSFYRKAVTALERLDLRGAFVLGKLDRETEAVVSPRLAMFSYAPMSCLLPHAVAAVHHAAYGTATSTLVYGRPSVAVPRALDQPFNAERLEALGVARSIAWDRLTAASLTTELGALLDNPEYAASAGILSAEMANEDGATRASDELERLAAAG